MKGLRILLVEDHEPTRTVLAQLLARRSYEVVTAASLRKALRWPGTSFQPVDLRHRTA